MSEDFFNPAFIPDDFKKTFGENFFITAMPHILITTQCIAFIELCRLLIKKGVITEDEYQLLLDTTSKKAAETFEQVWDSVTGKDSNND